jgi:DNA-binding NtrC family response regulator
VESILAIDDELSIRESYRMILAEEFRVLLADSGESGLKQLEKNHVDLILLDLMMPRMSGLQFLEHLQARDNQTPVVVVTALNCVQSAVEAMQKGARDYVIKPFDVAAIRIAIRRLLAERRAHRELEALRESAATGFGAIIGASSAMQQILEVARQAARVDSTVLITGESGTGKDLLARAIHSGGKRAAQPFVALSCCAIPAPLFESELFGHEKGAFTGAEQTRVGKMQVADQGTLFLDEIGEMPLETQAKLLRVLQDGAFYPVGSTKNIQVDARVVCATNRDLSKAIAEGHFRQDLFYRVNVLPIEMPPLRRRREDIPVLVRHFLAKHRVRINAQTEHLTEAALQRLVEYPWPGNIRELENTVERVLVHHGRKTTIAEEDVAPLLADAGPDSFTALGELEGLSLEVASNRLERHLIERALERSGRVQSRAAEMLGTTRRILKYKMDQLGIVSDEPRPESGEQAGGGEVPHAPKLRA